MSAARFPRLVKEEIESVKAYLADLEAALLATDEETQLRVADELYETALGLVSGIGRMQDVVLDEEDEGEP